MHIVALLIESYTATAATQRNKRQLLYFSRMAQQRGFRQRNRCRALANREKNSFPFDSSNVQQSCSGAKK